MLVTNILGVRKSDRTKQRIQITALRLFTEHGFDNVTASEVAEEAGVSHMTFFRHFPTKESVVLDDRYDPVLGAAVAAQSPDLSPLERVRRALLATWEDIDEPGDETTRIRIELAASHRSLRARVWENNLRTKEVIVKALTESGVRGLDAKVAAGAVLGAITAALFDWAEDPGEESLGDRTRHTMSMLEGVGR